MPVLLSSGFYPLDVCLRQTSIPLCQTGWGSCCALEKVPVLVGAQCCAESCVFRVLLNLKLRVFSPFKPQRVSRSASP